MVISISLRYPTFNITMPEVVQEIPKEAADSYMSGEHTGKELMNYADYGFGNLKSSIHKMSGARKRRGQKFPPLVHGRRIIKHLNLKSRNEVPTCYRGNESSFRAPSHQ